MSHQAFYLSEKTPGGLTPAGNEWYTIQGIEIEVYPLERFGWPGKWEVYITTGRGVRPRGPWTDELVIGKCIVDGGPETFKSRVFHSSFLSLSETPSDFIDPHPYGMLTLGRYLECHIRDLCYMRPDLDHLITEAKVWVLSRCV